MTKWCIRRGWWVLFMIMQASVVKRRISTECILFTSLWVCAIWLSPPQRPLCIVGRLLCWGWGERKRERAGHASHRPPRAFYFFRLLIFWWGYPAGASAEERGHLVNLYSYVIMVNYTHIPLLKFFEKIAHMSVVWAYESLWLCVFGCTLQGSDKNALTAALRSRLPGD